ncbi:MAG: LAGLIDADG family homing endonuclease [Patescibacteria group bacterium]|nr:LAGLIDADG family homing endonuclease [Patescibacteria group bacterium]
MKNKIHKRWNSKDIAFLQKNYREVAISELIKKLNRSRSSICHKANRIGLKRDNIGPLKRLPILAKEPSKELAWLVGYLLGDGYLTTSWTIGMKSKDNDLKNFYIKNLKKWSKFKKEEFVIDREEGEYNDKEKGKVYTCENIWVVRACSKEAWQLLKKFKDNPLYSLRFFPEEYWKFILKGLWDAEGHMTPAKGIIEIGFSNSNEKILSLYEKLCLSLGYHPLKFKDRDESKIMLFRMREAQDFVKRIGVTVQRKRLKIKKILRKIKRKLKKFNERIEIYNQLKKLKQQGMQRKEIWEKISRKVPISTFDKWFYDIRKPGKNFKI